MPSRRSHCHRRGAAIVYIVMSMTVMLGMASLAVDYGRVQLTKTRYQQAVETAARAAAAKLSQGTTAARAAAVQWADADSSGAMDLQSGEIAFGTWTNGAFVTGGTSPDAVRIEATRPVSLTLASSVGVASCNVTVSATVKMAPVAGGISGFIGLNEFYVKNNLFVGGYKSSVKKNPSKLEANLEGTVGSNVSVTAKNNEKVQKVVLGPDATTNLNGAEVEQLEEAIDAPAVDSSVYSGKTFTARSISGTQTLAGGTYYFSSLSLANNATLKFSGAATVYVNGNITFAQTGTITAYDNTPANLKIYQLGNHAFDGSGCNNMTITADVYAPTCTFESKNNLTFRGQGIFESFTAKNNADLYHDTDLPGSAAGGSGSAGVTLTLVE